MNKYHVELTCVSSLPFLFLFSTVEQKHTEAKHNVMAALYLDRKHEMALSLANRLFPGRSVEQILNWPLSEQVSGLVIDSYSKCHALAQVSS